MSLLYEICTGFSVAPISSPDDRKLGPLWFQVVIMIKRNEDCKKKCGLLKKEHNRAKASVFKRRFSEPMTRLPMPCYLEKSEGEGPYNPLLS